MSVVRVAQKNSPQHPGMKEHRLNHAGPHPHRRSAETGLSGFFKWEDTGIVAGDGFHVLVR
jgi:hypothetical protein